MSPIVINGRSLGVASNGIFTAANTDPIPGGKLWTEASAAWNAAFVGYVLSGGDPDDFVPAGDASSARTFPQQVALKAQWTRAGQPWKAATPGTSNHGWGLAVDVKTTRAAAWLLQNGHRYGISHDEGAAVGEWWHFRYVGGFKPRRRKRWDGFTQHERAVLREYDHLHHRRRDPHRQAQLRRWMVRERKRIWREAQSSTGGWLLHGRAPRYKSLLARTK